LNTMDTPSSSSSSTLVLRTVGLLILAALARFFYRMHQVRTLVRKFHRENDVVCHCPRSSHGLCRGFQEANHH
jgi:hypothetical protein